MDKTPRTYNIAPGFWEVVPVGETEEVLVEVFVSTETGRDHLRVREFGREGSRTVNNFRFLRKMEF